MQRRGPLAFALLPLAWLFGVLAAARRTLYRYGIFAPQRLPVPVVVVGGITVGGSGKTPLVLWLARALRARGLHPGIVSRGYKGSARTPRAVSPEDDPALVGDEPLLMTRRGEAPVWIGRDRVAAARALLHRHPECDVLLCDDGLQHYRLTRDFEIAVLDERGAGNGLLLPAGPLREGVARLAGVDAVVINGDAPLPLPAGVAPVYRMRLAGERFHRLAAPQQQCGPDDLRDMPLRAVAGIGNPRRFFDHLSRLGLAFRADVFPDHHAYRAEDLVVAHGEQLLMTEKDAVKCAALAPADSWVLPVDAVVAPDLAAAVVEKIRGFATA